MFKVTTTHAANTLLADIKAGVVPAMFGAPGIGKSAITHALADSLNLQLIDMRLAQHEPTDLVGFPMPNAQTGRMDFLPPAAIPLEGDDLPAGKDGWLLFLDELAQATPAVQNAALKLVLDKRVGIHALHPAVHIVCAGNRATDGAFAQQLSTALLSRMAAYELNISNDGWRDWALDNDIHPLVVAFIMFRPELLHKFDPASREPFPCPRTWEWVSKKVHLKDAGRTQLSYLQLAAGLVGEGAAAEFAGFASVLDSLPSFEAIVVSPNETPVPTDPSARYATVCMLPRKTDVKNVDQVLTYVMRLPMEFQMLAAKMLVRDAKLLPVSKLLPKLVMNMGAAFA